MRNLLLLLGITIITLTACTKPTCDDEGGVPDHDHYTTVSLSSGGVQQNSGSFAGKSDPSVTGKGNYRETVTIKLIGTETYSQSVTVSGTGEEVKAQLEGVVFNNVAYDSYEIEVTTEDSTFDDASGLLLWGALSDASIDVSANNNIIELTFTPASAFIKVIVQDNATIDIKYNVSSGGFAVISQTDKDASQYVDGQSNYRLTYFMEREGHATTSDNVEFHLSAGEYKVITLSIDEGTGSLVVSIDDNWRNADKN